MRWTSVLCALALCLVATGAQADQQGQAGNDYPTLALKNGWEGTVAFTLGIGIDGRVKSCTVTVSSGHQVLDDSACATLKLRARFKPATDAAGNPVEATYSSKLTYKLPR